MKKTSTVVKEKSAYEVDILINNTAYIKSVTGKTGLLNIKTNQIIGEMDYYHTIYDTRAQFFDQEKIIEKPSKEYNFQEKKRVTIYDAKREMTLVDNWEVVEQYGNNYNLVALKSPIDGKIHFLDKENCRTISAGIFDIALDSIEKSYSYYNDNYFVICVNGKKGIYQSGVGLITPIEYDDIEMMSNIFVYTKNNQKHFVCIGKGGKTSPKFESIRVDDKANNIAYCEIENQVYIYNTESQELLLISEIPDITYFTKFRDGFDDRNGEWVFLIKQDGKLGLISSKINREIRKSNNGKAIVTELLKPDYDEIKQDYNRFYIKKGEKWGLFISDSNNNQFFEPEFDKIDYYRNDYFVFYHGDYCNIAKVTSDEGYEEFVADCQIQDHNEVGIIYKKKGKFGIICIQRNHRDEVIPNEYDNINFVAKYYLLLQQEGKKGLMHLGIFIIPVEYDDLQIGGFYGKYESLAASAVLYFALKKGDKYKLAKMYNDQYGLSDIKYISDNTFNSIDFYKDIMVLKDNTATYICSYNEKWLNTLPVEAEITPIERPRDDQDSSDNSTNYFYCIDGEYYYYKDDKFEKVMVEENDCYITTYETDKDTFEIKTFNKEVHDSFCQLIDIKDDEEAEKSLITMSENKKEVTNKYPTLTLKRVQKNK